MSDSLTILLVDDHPIVREGYRRLIERTPGRTVVAEASTAGEAYIAYKEASPSIVIMDWSLPGLTGLEGIRHILQWDKNARILVFTMHENVVFALKAIEAGAYAYVTKSSPPGELVQAIETVSAGGRALSKDIARMVADERHTICSSPLKDLNARELEILRMVASGITTERIARMLNLSLKTVQNNLYGIKAKTGAETDAHLVWFAIQAGLVHEHPLASRIPSGD